jgi:hypothetical protein
MTTVKHYPFPQLACRARVELYNEAGLVDVLVTDAEHFGVPLTSPDASTLSLFMEMLSGYLVRKDRAGAEELLKTLTRLLEAEG